MSLPGLLDLSKMLLSTVIRPGDVCVDATMGNGHDTLFLAEAVGPGGLVYGFDIQEQAAKETSKRLEASPNAGEALLLLTGHECMTEHIKPEHAGRIAAVMFNLGYLPGSDKQVVTAPSGTMPALTASLSVMREGGMLSVMVYTGHPGGEEEKEAVLTWCSALAAETHRTLRIEQANKAVGRETLLLVEKMTIR